MRLRRVLQTAIVTFGLSVLCARSGVPPAHAQTIDENLWVTNGQVSTVARDGNSLYIGGFFTRVSAATGGGVPLLGTDSLPAAFPKVAGRVLAAISDGAGGWYIGGDFSAVGGRPRRNIARIARDMSVTAFDPNANHTVRALATNGVTVWAGGDFDSVGGLPRNHLAAFDTTIGAPTAWNPNVNGPVYALDYSELPFNVYAGGDFSTVGGQTRNNIVSINMASGSVTSWDANADTTVRALAVDGSTIYAGGQFTTIGGQTRNYIAALNNTTGAAIAGWNPNATGTVRAILVEGSTIYAGGDFTNIGGQNRGYVAALSNLFGTATSWNPNANSTVHALASNGSLIYVGGIFSTIGLQPRSRVAAVDGSGVVTSWNPSPNNHVFALAVSSLIGAIPQRVYLGGQFSGIGGQVRNRLAAIDLTTGMPTSWNPNPDGSEVNAILVRGSTVYAGGDFQNIGGQPRNRIAALSAATGTATGWNPNADGTVLTLAASGGTVLAGGSFANIGSGARARVAALDTTSGNATSWAPNADNTVRVLTVNGSTVYAGGDFQNIGGQPRNRIAALDAGGLATGWNPNASGSVRAIAVNGSTVYAGGVFSTIGSASRNGVAALDASSGLATTFTASTNGQVLALAVDGGTLYVGGGLSLIGGHTRSYLAAVDAVTGAVATWNPNPDAVVRSLCLGSGGTTLHASGDFTSVAGLPSGCLAAIGATIAPVVSVVQPDRGSNVGPVTVMLSGSNLQSGATVKLARVGNADIPATDVTVDSFGSGLVATFDLSGKAEGLWDVVVTNPAGTSGGLPLSFTVEPDAIHQLRVDVIGQDRMRADRRRAFDVVIQNLGNADVLAVPLWIHRIPVDATVELDFPVASVPREGGEPDWSAVPDSLVGPGGVYIPLVIPRIPPGVTVRRIYIAVPNTVTGFELGAAITPRWADGSVFRSCLSDGDVIQNPACMGSRLGALNAHIAGIADTGAVSAIGFWSKIAWPCEGATTLPQALAKAEQVLDFMLQPLEGAAVPPSCSTVLQARWHDVLAVSIVGSIDPNDKLGIGLGMNQKISPDNYLTYSIRFENIATATGPAQDVVVTDHLDAARLDLSLLTLGPITFGNRTIPAGPGTSGSWLIDLRPQRNLKVQVNAQFNGGTGELKWTFASINPDNPSQPPPDTVGFLPPNVHPPEGEGSLLFTVKPRHGLSDSTTITNAATIKFDTNAPLQTPTWSNRLDTTPPQSRVLPLAANQDPALFTVQWEAVDQPPDFRDCTVRVWFTLPRRESAMLDVVDVAGRRVARRDVGALGPGRHSIDLSGPMRRPGIYFMRLAQGGVVARARVAVIR